MTESVTKVFDSWALMAFLNGEPAAKQVEQLLDKAREGKCRILLCVINWGEIYYIVLRKSGAAVAEQVATALATLGIELVGVAEDIQLIREAAKFKAFAADSICYTKNS